MRFCLIVLSLMPLLTHAGPKTTEATPIAKVRIDCRRILNMMSDKEKQHFQAVFKTVQQLRKENPIEWKSTEVTQKVLTAERAEWIVDQLFNKESALVKELAAYNEKLRTTNSLWNVYLAIYDSFLAYSDGYRDIFLKAHEVLPSKGTIADYGFGTANGIAFLASLAPERHFVGADSSQEGRAQADKKLRTLSEALKRPIHADLKSVKLEDYILPDNSVDGAVMNNVFYTLPLEVRPLVLKHIFRQLKPGSKLVLNDPGKLNMQEARTLILDSARSVVGNKSPVTEQEFALIFYINIYYLLGNNTFSSSEELAKTMVEAGFNVKNSFSSLFGSSTFLILEKPIR